MQTDAKARAVSAVEDLLRHFWVGDAATGHVLDTWSGRARRGDDRGILWERAMFLGVVHDLYQGTHDPVLHQRLQADWTYLKKRFRPEELQACGNGTENNWSDDAGWSALMALEAYQDTGDKEALTDAEALFNNACARWADDTLGGGLWYNDERKVKSVYQANLILAGVWLSEVTGDPAYRDRALPLYNWVEAHLLRSDGLYWCDYGAKGPHISGNHREAASDTFLGGNMAMGIIAARLYRDTGQAVYKDRALRAAQAVSRLETDGKGALMDDRDAWTNGYFMGYWVRDVLTLPGTKREARAIVRRTAEAIWQRARTSEGFYSGCWNGPAEGEACPWTKGGFTPQQIMTSSSAVHVLVGADLLGNLTP